MTNTAMRDHCIANGIVDDSPFRYVKIYKVFHPHPMIYVFDQNGLTHCGSAEKFDLIEGQYASNKSRVISKCNALHVSESQREPVREIRFLVDVPQPDLSINGNTLLHIINHHMEITRSFETSDLLMFFEKENTSLDEAERVFGKYVEEFARHFPEKRR